jgi:hypothetical protein
MNILTKTAITVVAVMVAAGSAQAGHKGGKCVKAGGEATMVTEDLAKYMAGAALKNSIAAHGWTAMGAATTKCDTAATGLPHCVAHQKACG